MPAYQPRPEWLHEAVAGALAQRDCELELLVVDDGSPEPVADLLSEFRDVRLRIIRVDHGGKAGATNTGIKAAGGDYMRFIDADDVIDPDSTARLLALNEGRGDVIAYGATMFCDENLRPLWRMTSDVEGDAVISCLMGRFTTRPHAFLFPRRVIEATGEWSTELTVSEDWDFILRALEHAQVRGTHEVATNYRRHQGGLTSDPAAGERGAQSVVAGYFERHPEQRGTRIERQARARMLAHIGRVYATHGQLGKGLRDLAAAARHDPVALWVELRQGIRAAAASRSRS
jgi:hypothetical protein